MWIAVFIILAFVYFVFIRPVANPPVDLSRNQPLSSHGSLVNIYFDQIRVIPESGDNYVINQSGKILVYANRFIIENGNKVLILNVTHAKESDNIMYCECSDKYDNYFTVTASKVTGDFIVVNTGINTMYVYD